jgi:hypothetical protein
MQRVDELEREVTWLLQETVRVNAVSLMDISSAVCRVGCGVIRERTYNLVQHGSGVILKYGPSKLPIVFTAAHLFDGLSEGQFHVYIGTESEWVFTAKILCKSGEVQEHCERCFTNSPC